MSRGGHDGESIRKESHHYSMMGTLKGKKEGAFYKVFWVCV